MSENGNKKPEDKKIKLEVIIGGTSYGEFEFPGGINIGGLLAQVLEKTKNTAQPPENWDIKDLDGNVLDTSLHLRDYEGLTQVWLSVKAGIGG